MKKEGSDPMMAIAKGMAKAIYEHLGFFRSFDEVVVFYDNGQTQLKTMLLSIFSANFLNFSLVSFANFLKLPLLFNLEQPHMLGFIVFCKIHLCHLASV